MSLDVTPPRCDLQVYRTCIFLLNPHLPGNYTSDVVPLTRFPGRPLHPWTPEQPQPRPVPALWTGLQIPLTCHPLGSPGSNTWNPVHLTPQTEGSKSPQGAQGGVAASLQRWPLRLEGRLPGADACRGLLRRSHQAAPWFPMGSAPGQTPAFPGQGQRVLTPPCLPHLPTAPPQGL